MHAMVYTVDAVTSVVFCLGPTIEGRSVKTKFCEVGVGVAGTSTVGRVLMKLPVSEVEESY